MIQLIKGFKDILPGEVEIWQQIERITVSLLEDFGFKEIRIPIMEHTELFARSIGEDTDIVEKEMYTFQDRSGDLVTLRPEATASVCRAYIQHKLFAKEPVQKLFTIGPMFRCEKPQKGRYRQFYQINAEIFGVASPLADVELIVLLTTLFSRLLVSDIKAHINSLGCPECRPGFKDALTDFLESIADKLCSNCVRRKERNPLRVLDCKVQGCRQEMAESPSLMDYLCPECLKDFETVKTTLESLNIPFIVDKRLVRGLDYYNRTTFEIQTGSLGAQNAVAGGGRYDGLVKELGGPDMPATGFAIGFDRLTEIVRLNIAKHIKTPDLFLAVLGKENQSLGFEWKCALGIKGVKVEMDFSDRSLKSQMKRADKMKAKHVLIVGDKEVKEGLVILRNMATKKQEWIPIEGIVDNVIAKL